MQCIALSVLRLLPQINHQLHKHSVIKAGRLKTCSALTLASAKAPCVPTLTFIQIAPPGKHFSFKFLSPLHASMFLTLIQGQQVFSVYKSPASLALCSAWRTRAWFSSAVAASSCEVQGKRKPMYVCFCLRFV